LHIECRVVGRIKKENPGQLPNKKRENKKEEREQGAAEALRE